MAAASTAVTGLATDARSIDRLRTEAQKDPKAAAKQVGQQFEALFMHQLLKSMREATMKSGMWDSASSDLYTDMLDQQLSQKVAGGSGLADLIARQLTRHMEAVKPESLGKSPRAVPASGAAAGATAPAEVPVRIGPVKPTQSDFVKTHLESAKAASAISGIPAEYILGQAAHESAWGAREIRNADGSSAHNLFGIKAGAGWTGKVAQVTTTEYVDGVARKTVAKFRAYDSYDDAFRDYAGLIKNSPRYEGVVREGATVAGFTNGLQRAGYATDPAYAGKLARIIHQTLAVARTLT